MRFRYIVNHVNLHSWWNFLTIRYKCNSKVIPSELMFIVLIMYGEPRSLDIDTDLKTPIRLLIRNIINMKWRLAK